MFWASGQVSHFWSIGEHTRASHVLGLDQVQILHYMSLHIPVKFGQGSLQKSIIYFVRNFENKNAEPLKGGLRHL